ncbi:MAG TPA: ABC transporter ATP-binding protein [Pseudolysinimonas sp.]|jgi:iron complex transport system ATP-binding protein|nr:ABC transporter ATP-binding protein [Pseudolysinimonas sp.]
MSAASGPLEVRGVTVRAGTITLVEQASFDAPAGALTALLGPNGAGKSTLLRAVAGVERPASGSVTAGDDLLALPRRERARRVAFVEQESQTELPLTVRAVVGLGRAPYESVLGGRDPDAADAVDEAMRVAGVAGFALRDVTTLSGGERQRVMLARALAQRPGILILDEPTNHLDIAAQLEVLELLTDLARGGTTVLAALHDLGLAAAHADNVVVLSHGRVVASGATPSTLTPALVHDVFGVEASFVPNPLTGRPLLATRRPAPGSRPGATPPGPSGTV